MITTVIQLITGAIGSVGFGILFHMKNKYLPLAAAGGEGNLGRGFSAIITGWIYCRCVCGNSCKNLQRDFYFLFRYFRDSSHSRKHTLLLYEQYCRGKYSAGTGIWTGYFSFCFWNCGRDEYCVGDLLFFQKYKEKIELTVDCKLTKSSKSLVSITNI